MTQPSIIFLLQGKEESALCYFNQAGSAGWCGTCYEGDLSPGQEGYCDYYNGKIMCLMNTFIIYILM